MLMQNSHHRLEEPLLKTSPALLSLMKFESGIDLPAEGDPCLEKYLYERYKRDSLSWPREIYYTLKPLIPRPVQLALRRSYAGRQARYTFPAWPMEPTVLGFLDDYVAALLRRNRIEAIHRLGLWPRGSTFAFAITHDVEWDTGLLHAPDVVELERSYGFVSSWNIVPERYPIDWDIVNRLRSMGCEIGVHGLRHDGKLFRSEKHFRRAAGVINDYAREWKAVGFRSESTLRNADWMASLAIGYDSSFPDTDPYEPQPGGCCSIWPYFIGDVVELPLTLPQDHTLFEILAHDDISVWKSKSDWIERNWGLALLNVHPDYLFVGERLHFYEMFLKHMRGKRGMWHALPRDIAQWWRDRDRSLLFMREGEYVVDGPIAGRASVIESTLQGGMIHHRRVSGNGNDLPD